MEARLFMVHVDSNPTEASRIAAETARKIESKELKLLELVQPLGELMTDEDATVRAKAIAYLSAVLAAVDVKCLTRQHVAVLTQFLTDRLEDETGLKEVAQGLIALMNMPRFSAEEAELVIISLCKVDLKKHPQGTRFVVLMLLDGLMAKHRNVMKKLGDQFIDGLIDLVQGEKDPRNLMIIFSVVKVVLVEFDILRHVDSLFDVVYVYYPITFTPPPNDPYGITAQDLKVRLRDCLAATPLFAEHVFGPLIEKLDSTSQSVKKDVLQTMAACALSYGPVTMAKYHTSLWDAVKFEVLNSTGPDDEMAEEALKTVSAIAKALTSGLNIIPPKTTPASRYLATIVKECNELLREPQQKQSKPAGQILASVTIAGTIAHAYVIKNTLPKLLDGYSDADSISKQRAFMEVFNQLFAATSTVYGEWGEIERFPDLENPLQDFKDKLFEIYSQALMGANKEEIGFRLVSLKGLGRLSKIRRLFADNEMGMVVQYLDEVVLEREANASEEIRDEASRALLEISRMKPSLILEITFPAFMAQLPDSEAESKKTPYILILEALARLSIGRPIFEVLLTRLLNKLDLVLKKGSSPGYPHAILSTLLYVIQKKSEDQHADLSLYYDRIVPSLLTKTILNLIEDAEGKGRVLADDTVLDVTGRIVNLLVRSLEAEKQKQVLDDAFSLFIYRRPSGMILEQNEEVSSKFFCFGEDAVSEHVSSIAIFTCIIAAIRREVPLPLTPPEDVISFSQKIIASSLQFTSQFHTTALLRLLAIIINKWLKDSTPLRATISTYLSQISSFPSLTPISLSHLRIIFWVTKSLILKSDPYGDYLLSNLVSLLQNPSYGAPTSSAFSLILSPDEFLNKENYAITRLLARQRTFNIIVPELVQGFKTAATGPAQQPNYLIALSNILRNVPSKLILPSLPSLLPLLLQSIDLPDTNVKLATLETLYVTILESADAVSEHLSSLINRLLAAATFSPSPGHGAATTTNPPKVRIAALKCLRVFPGLLRTEVLVPHSKKVVRGLVSVLDDPKRVVRKEAVECRAGWMGLVVLEE